MFSLAAAVLLTHTLSATAQTRAPATGPAADEVRVGEVLVKLAGLDAKLDDEAADRAAVHALHELSRDAGVPLSLVRRSFDAWVVVSTPATTPHATEALAARLAGHKGVLAAEPHRVLHALRLPDDDLTADNLWGMFFIDAPVAWDTTIGSSSQRVGIVDTGLAPHGDLTHVRGGFDFVSNGGLDGDGRDGDFTDTVRSHGDSHGTHVAGTIGASGEDGFGLAGVNWRAGLMIARALGDEGAGSLDDIMNGARWLAGLHVSGVQSIGNDQVSVINMSLGGDHECTEFEQDAIDGILAAGVVVVAAAGNSGNDVPVGSPANCDGVIAVGAYGFDAALASYSNFSARIDVLAPGGDGIDADDPMVLSTTFDDGYAFLQGTSMATPHVTGVVSLMQAVNPTLSPRQIRTVLTETPLTCDGCNDERAVDAGYAVQRAQELRGELGTDGSDGNDDSSTDVDNGNTGGNGNTGNGNDGGSCDAARGNWDCEQGFGCVDGACVDGAHGAKVVGELCSEDGDCDSGLCDRGVCTRPCDDGCDAGYSCDESAGVPGGLCVADSCEEHHTICGDLWCTYSDAGHYVCALEENPNYPSVYTGCSASRTPTALPLLGLMLLAVRRRRR